METRSNHLDQKYTPIGNQPVRVLELNVLDWFEGKYPEFRSELEQIGAASGASRSIKYYCDEAPIRNPNGGVLTPHIAIKNGEIGLYETFLSYVWALSYSILVIHDEQLKGKMTGIQPLHRKPIGHFLQYGFDVLNFGLSLVEDYKPWPADLPNPDPKWYRGEDDFFPTRANGIYLAAVDFILCHEVAHVACGHLKKIAEAQSKGECLSRQEIKAVEAEADRWALKRVIRGINDTTRAKTTVGFGAVAGLASVLFLGTELTSDSHPDTDTRFRAVLEGLGEEKTGDLWGIVASYYIAWSTFYGVRLDFDGEFDTYCDLVDEIERQLQDRKVFEEMRGFGFD